MKARSIQHEGFKSGYNWHWRSYSTKAASSFVCISSYHSSDCIIISTDTNSVLEEEKEYIMRCILENTSAKELDRFHEESCRSCLVEPLLMYFSVCLLPWDSFLLQILVLYLMRPSLLLEKVSRKTWRT